MKFTLNANILDFEHGADYPITATLEKVQALDRTDSGHTEVEQLGPSISTRVLSWSLMCYDDFLALKHWFDVVANGAVNSFEFEDELGFTGTVIITSNMYDFTEIRHQVHAGSLTLEYV